MKDLFPAWVHRVALWPFWIIGCVAATGALFYGSGLCTDYLVFEYVAGVVISSFTLMLLIVIKGFDEVRGELLDACLYYRGFIRKRLSNRYMFIGRAYVAAVLATLSMWSVVGLMVLDTITVFWCLYQMDATIADFTETQR